MITKQLIRLSGDKVEFYNLYWDLSEIFQLKWVLNRFKSLKLERFYLGIFIYLNSLTKYNVAYFKASREMLLDHNIIQILNVHVLFTLKVIPS